MVYDLDVTNNHPLANKFALNFNDLIKADGGKGVFPENAIAISLDMAEKAERRAKNLKTMDSAIGVIARRSSGKKCNERMLMCEFRCNYKNSENISKTELEEKIENSKSHLQWKYTGQIEPCCYFIFSERIIHQARSRFARIYNTRIKDREVVTEEGFRDLIF